MDVCITLVTKFLLLSSMYIYCLKIKAMDVQSCALFFNPILILYLILFMELLIWEKNAEGLMYGYFLLHWHGY